MNQEDLMNAIGTVDEEVLEKTEQKPKSRKLLVSGLVAAVACLVLVLVLPFAGPGYHTVAEKPLFFKPIVYESNTEVNMSVDLYGGFKNGISLEVKLTKLFRDTYFNLTDADCWRVAEFTVLDTIVGSNVPKVIYLRLPAAQYKNWEKLKKYDSLIVSVWQVALEGAYPMVNMRTNKVERFGTLFGVDSYAVAMKNGKMDESYSHICKTDTCHENALFVSGRSLADAKKAIQELAAKTLDSEGRRNVITPDKLTNDEVRKAYEYVLSTNGDSFFAPYYYSNSYVRYIDGYMTEEVVHINLVNGTVEYSGTKYTDDILESAIKVKNVIKKLKPEKMAVPEIPAIESGTTRIYEGHAAGYRIKSGQTYCLITLIWRDYEEGNTKSKRMVRVNKLVMPDGTIHDYTYKGSFSDYLDSL